MAYEANAIEVMIASPSDVVRERQIVRDVIAEWNAIHSRREKTCLMPTGWETHSSPALSGRAQELINERVLKHADLLVGIFWTRVGSPTGKSISGSIEEIERHLEAGKPVMLYFSTAPVVPSSFDKEQYDALEKFKEWAKGQGLVETFEDATDFATKFRAQLQLELHENQYLRRQFAFIAKADPAAEQEEERTQNPLSADATELLMAAAADPQGMIAVLHYLGGSSIAVGSREFAQENDRRSVARWSAAVDELYHQGLMRDINGKGEIFEINHAGYQLADALRRAEP